MNARRPGERRRFRLIGFAGPVAALALVGLAHSRSPSANAATAGGFAAVTGNLVKDGGFERPSTSGLIKTVSAGGGIGPWQVTVGSVDDVQGGYWPAAAGQQSVDVAGDGPGTISQSLTVPGTGVYRLKYSLAGNPQCAPTVKRLGIWWDGTLVATRHFDTSSHTVADLGWVVRSIRIPATPGSHTLGFSSLSGGPCGPVIDEVSLRAAVH